MAPSFDASATVTWLVELADFVRCEKRVFETLKEAVSFVHELTPREARTAAVKVNGWPALDLDDVEELRVASAR